MALSPADSTTTRPLKAPRASKTAAAPTEKPARRSQEDRSRTTRPEVADVLIRWARGQ